MKRRGDRPVKKTSRRERANRLARAERLAIRIRVELELSGLAHVPLAEVLPFIASRDDAWWHALANKLGEKTTPSEETRELTLVCLRGAAVAAA
jgi:hypothetical protein